MRDGLIKLGARIETRGDPWCVTGVGGALETRLHLPEHLLVVETVARRSPPGGADETQEGVVMERLPGEPAVLHDLPDLEELPGLGLGHLDQFLNRSIAVVAKFFGLRSRLWRWVSHAC